MRLYGNFFFNITVHFIISFTEAREENLSLIDEAVAIRCVLKHRLLQQNGNSELDMEVIASMILTDLQRKQDTQMAAAVARVTKMVINLFGLLIISV